jgi:hypothetical protein
VVIGDWSKSKIFGHSHFIQTLSRVLVLFLLQNIFFNSFSAKELLGAGLLPLPARLVL